VKREELRLKIFGVVVWRTQISGDVWPSRLERRTVEGDSPVHAETSMRTIGLLRVELFGIAALSGW